MKLITKVLAAVAAFTLSMGAAAAQTTMQEIQEAGVVKVGMADSLPFQFKDVASGDWRGFNVDMAAMMAEELGVELEIVDQTWATLIPALTSGQIDVAFVDMVATPKRAVSVSFTDSYFAPEGVILVNSGSGLKTWDDLNQPGKTIVALAGTATELAARAAFPNAEVRPMVADGETALLLEVTSNRADGTVTANVNAGLYLSRNPNAPLELLEGGRGIPSQGYSYAVRPEDTHLRAFLNTFINSARDTGLRDEMEQKWIFNFPG